MKRVAARVLRRATQDSSVDLIWACLTVVSVLPFWSAELLALTDWPHHLASAAVILSFDDPARHLSDYYRLALTPRPYLGMTYLLVGLGQFMPITWAGKVVLSLYAVSTSVATRALVRAAPGRDPRLAWFGSLFVHSWALAYGFVPFVCALPPAIYAVARLRRLLDHSDGWGWTVLAVSYGVSALMHPLGFAIAVVASAGLMSAARATWRTRFVWAGVVAGVGLWSLASAHLDSTEGVRFMDLGITTAWRWTIKHRLIDFALAYLPGNVDYVVSVLGIGALVWALALGRVRPQCEPDPLERASLAVIALYLLAPVNLAVFSLRMSLLSPRMIVPMWLFALPLVRGRTPRLLLVVVLAVVGHSALLAQTHRRLDQRWGPAVQTAIAQTPLGATVLANVAMPKQSVLNARTVRPPEAALHAYVLLDRAGFDPRLFSTPQGPVHILEAAPMATNSEAFDALWQQSATELNLEVLRLR